MKRTSVQNRSIAARAASALKEHWSPKDARTTALADRQTPAGGLTRWTGAIVGVFATLVVCGAAPAAAETRTLDLYYTHTRERLTITFKKDGRYIPSALKQLNHFLRDWRRNEPTNMDPRLFDTVWELYRQSGSRQPIHIVSAYRSPATNSMLRARSKAVAKHSQHTLGKAMDLFLPDVSINKLRAIGMKMQRGGVGWYPNSNSPFVHIDVGSVRSWPRMSRTQLTKLFPDGKTVHLPTDGKPLAGYQQALAELKRNGGTPSSALAMADEETKGRRRGGLLAMLFGDEEDSTEELNAATMATEEAPAQVKTRKVAPPPAEEPAPVILAKAPLPPVILAKAPLPPVEPEVKSLADAKVPAGPVPALVASAAPPPVPRGKPAELLAMAEMQVAMAEAPVMPKAKPMFEPPALPAAVLAAAAPAAPPEVRPTLAAVEPAVAAAPATAQQALEEVARVAPGVAEDVALGYAAPESLAALPPPAAAPARRTAPKLLQASLGNAFGKAPEPAAADPLTGRTDPAAALPPLREDQLATLTTFLPPADLPVYDPDQGMAGRAFAILIHPDQRRDGLLFAAPVTVFKAGFQPYGTSPELSYSRFAGDAVVRLATIRIPGGSQQFALR